MGAIWTLTAFLSMEFMAWFTHKYVMHGWLWVWHEDHHTPGKSFFEKNDYFFLLFAIPSATLCITGALSGYDYKFFLGFGILLYGICYFLVHDVFIHQRFKWLRNSKHPYLKALRRAHKVHHKHLQKEDGECFGMLVVPYKYFADARKRKSTSP